MRSRLFDGLVGLFLVIFGTASFFATNGKSPAYDEPPHIAAGLSYVQTGQFAINPQHPPLLKELSGFAMTLGGIRWPQDSEAKRWTSEPGGGKRTMDWDAGRRILKDNQADKVLAWARLPMIAVALLLGVVVYAWGRQMLGPAAAAGAVLLYTTSPNVMAHSYLVTTDVGFAAFAMLFFFALWRYARRPDRAALACCGLALGAALGAKFAAVALFPLGAALLAVAALGVDKAARAKQQRPLPAGVKAGPNDSCPCGSGAKFKRCHGARQAGSLTPGAGARLKMYGYGLAAMAGIALVVMMVLYVSPEGPVSYWRGIREVHADHDASYRGMVAGDTSERLLSYFAIVYLLKEPLAGVVLLLVGLWVLWRTTEIPALAKWFLLLPPAALFTAYSLWAEHLGVRYLLPVLPFAYLVGGLGLAALFRNSTLWSRATGVVLAGWLCVAAAGIYPDHLSYFNEAACLLTDASLVGLDGGSRCGTRWLDDSNVDWGQSLPQLRAWLDRNGGCGAMKLAYYGAYLPEEYGIGCKQMDARTLMLDPQPGTYIVSAHYVARIPALRGASQWLREKKPKETIGHAYYVYELGAAQAD